MLSFIEIHLKICSTQEYQRPDTTHVDEIHTTIPAGEGGTPLIGCPRPKSHRTVGWSPWYESRTGSQGPGFPRTTQQRPLIRRRSKPPRIHQGSEPTIMYAESVHPCSVWPVCWALLCNLVFLLPQNKIQTTCLSNNEFKTRTGKAPHIPPFPHSPPSLLSDHHNLPSRFPSVRLLFLRPTSYLSPHPHLTQYILMSLF